MKKVDMTLFKYHFARGTWISLIWNWLLINVGRAAEGYLTLSVLYQGASLLPGVHTSASLDNTVFIGQQLALDIGGVSLAKQSQQTRESGNIKQANLERAVGFLLISLMVANVILSLFKKMQIIPAEWVVGIEACLLILRSIMAVLYGYIVYSPTSAEDAHVVKTSDIHERLDQFSERLQMSEISTRQQIQQVTELFHKKIEASETSTRFQLQQVLEGMQRLEKVQTAQSSTAFEKVQVEGRAVQVEVLNRLEKVQVELQESLSSEVQLLGAGLQEYVVEKLQLVESELQTSLIEAVSPLSEILQEHAELFATFPDQLTMVTEEFQQVKITVERQSQAIPQLIAAQRTVTSAPVIKNKVPLQLPTKRSEVVTSARFNKTQFVLDCLKEESEMSSSDIKSRAAKLQQSVTDPIISMARKEFKLKCAEGEVEETFEVENEPITGEFEKIAVGK